MCQTEIKSLLGLGVVDGTDIVVLSGAGVLSSRISVAKAARHLGDSVDGDSPAPWFPSRLCDPVRCLLREANVSMGVEVCQGLLQEHMQVRAAIGHPDVNYMRPRARRFW